MNDVLLDWEDLKEIAEGLLIVVHEDLVDYLSDLARATDSVEMGGVLLGKGRWVEQEKYIVQLYDFVQVDNASDTPSREFAFPDESVQEIRDLIDRGIYDLSVAYHSHPGGSWPSMTDILLSLAASPARPGTPAIHDFLVTGGTVSHIITYGPNKARVCYKVLGEQEWVCSDSVPMEKAIPGYLERFKERFPREVIESEIHEDASEVYEAASEVEYTAVPIGRLTGQRTYTFLVHSTYTFVWRSKATESEGHIAFT